MPMLNKVSDTSTDGCTEDAGTEIRDIAAAFLVQEGRTAATKGLLHDFSNVMVGLCSLSENALDETEPGSPLYDDMEIIRDSAVRAQQLIRRISTLNGDQSDEEALLDLVSWLRGESETLRAAMPKGSTVTLPGVGRTVLATIAEPPLRDFLLTVTTCFSKPASGARILLDLDVSENDNDCILRMKFSGAGVTQADGATPGGAGLSAAMSSLARRLGASSSLRLAEDGGVIIELALHAVVRSGG